MSPAVLRPLTAGEILDGAFTIYRRQFVTLLTLAAVLQGPNLVIHLTAPKYAAISSLAFASILGPALIYASSEAVLGRSPRIGASLACGLRKLIPAALDGFAYGLFIVLGSLSIVGGILFAIMFFVWQPVLVLEGRLWPFGRARALARRSWGKITSLMLLTVLITSLPSQSVLIGAEFAQIQAILRGQGHGAIPHPGTWLIIATLVLAALTAPFSSAVVTLLYYDQRARKEGLGVEMQAAALSSPPPAAE